jgi:hypothetical protein
MAIPNVTFNIVENGLGNTPPSPANTVAIFGCSQGGTAATVNAPYQVVSNLVTDYGYGPGPELAAQLIQSGIPTIFVKVATTAAGAAGTVTHAGSGASVLTITGAPIDAYTVIVTVVRAGTAGTAPEPGFTISLDGGLTTSREIRMPSNHIYAGLAATTGMTLNFTAATLAVGDTYTFTTTAPTWVVADVETAINALRASTHQAALLYVVGAAAESDAAGIVTALAQFNGTYSKRFIRTIVEARDIDTTTAESEATWMAAIEADYATFQSDLVGVAAGGHLNVSAISGVSFRRNIGWLAIVRAGLTKVSRGLNAVADGALAASKGSSPISVVYHDEAKNPGLDANRFITVRSFDGLNDYYITNPNLMCGPTSDFTLLQYGRVMDEACVIANTYFTGLLGGDVRLNRKTGFILERDALAIESASTAVLEEGLLNTGDVSAIWTEVSRTDNISNTKTLTVTIKILPLGYIGTVSATLTFVNPAFGQVAQAA